MWNLDILNLTKWQRSKLWMEFARRSKRDTAVEGWSFVNWGSSNMFTLTLPISLLVVQLQNFGASHGNDPRVCKKPFWLSLKEKHCRT